MQITFINYLAVTVVFFFNIIYSVLGQTSNENSQILLNISKLKNDSAKIMYLLNTGENIENTNPDSSIVLYKIAANIGIKSKNFDLAGLSYIYIAFLYGNTLYNDTACESNYLKAVDFYTLSNNIKRKAKCYQYLGDNFIKFSNFQKSLHYFNLSLDLLKENKDSAGIANNLTSIGNVYRAQSDFKNAIKYYSEAKDLSLKINNINELLNSISNLGNVYYFQGDYKTAMQYYQETYNYVVKTHDEHKLSITYLNIGNVFNIQGIYKEAIDNYNKAIELAEKLKNNRLLLLCYNNLGTIYYYQRKFDEAEIIQKKTINLSKLLNNKEIYATSLFNLGNVQYCKGEFDTAIYSFNKSIEISKELNLKDKEALAYGSFANLYMTLADSSKANKEQYIYNLQIALSYQDKALSIAKEIGSKPIETTAYKRYLNIYNALNETKKAAEYGINLIKMRNDEIKLNFTFLSENDKALFIKNIEEDFFEFNSFCLKTKETMPELTGYVYDYFVVNKRLLLRSSTVMRNLIQSSNDSVLIKSFNQWLELKKYLVELNSGNINQNNEEIKKNEVLADSIERELVKKSQFFEKIKKEKITSWTEIQKKLKPNEAVIEFIHFPIKGSNIVNITDSIIYCALIIRKDSKYPTLIPLFYEKQLKNMLNYNDIKNINALYSYNSSNPLTLFNIIWKPLLIKLKDVKTIYLSPTGLLNKVNFSSIETNNNNHLCNLYNIENISSSFQLLQPKTKFIYKKGVFTIFGGIDYNINDTNTILWQYLDGTKKEAGTIYNLIKNKHDSVRLFTSKNASEEKFKETVKNSSVVHIATHGFYYNTDEHEAPKNLQEERLLTFRGSITSSKFYNADPMMRTGLVFAGANSYWNDSTINSFNDGILTSYEILTTNMTKTELIVLSACETGLGDIKGSEGVYGLQRAFKMAGVKNIIMSLWQVPDKETVEFMETFYIKLLKTKNIQKSFIDTQRKMQKKYDPYFWAAFVLMD